MSSFLLIGVCMISGFLLRKYGVVAKEASRGVNTWIIYVALPAVSFKYLPHIEWSKELLIPALSPLAVWCVALLWVKLVVKFSRRSFDQATIGGMKIVAGLCNTSFVGFPLIIAYFGADKLGIAVIPDQITFLLLSTVGLTAAIKGSAKGAFSYSLLLKRIVKFPPVWGCLLALTVPHFVSLEPLSPMFDTLAGTVGPLALFSIGMQISFEGWKQEWKTIGLLVFYKLILAPAVIFLVLFFAGFSGNIPKISIFEAAMPTLLTSGIIAEEFQLNTRVVNLTIGFSILLSFITTAGWYFVLRLL